MLDENLHKHVNGTVNKWSMSTVKIKVFKCNDESVLLEPYNTCLQPVLNEKVANKTPLLIHSKIHIEVFINYINCSHFIMRFHINIYYLVI